MLPANFKLTVNNAAGTTMTLSAVMNPWKFGTDGALSYRGAQAPLTATDVADANSGDTGAYDNSSNLDLGSHLEITLTPGASATGTATVYMKILGADQETIALCSHTWSADATAKVIGVEI